MQKWTYEDGELWIQMKRQRERGLLKACERCGINYVTRKVAPGKYCAACFRRGTTPQPKPCESCGQEFRPAISTRRFCSRRCRSDVLRGERHHKWKGGISSDGYVMVTVDQNDPIGGPMLNGARNVLEHRLVMARYLGRPLAKDELVHHSNGIRHDNRLENLELWRTGHPNGQKVEDQVAWAREIIARYGDYVPPS